jgi:hypothetical protein
MSDEPRPDEPGPDDVEAHLDAMSEIEAEADAEVSGLDEELAHLAHPRARHGDGAGPSIAPDVIGSVAPPNPRADRQRFLVAYLRVALAAAFVIGVLELILPEDLRDEAATVMVAVFVAAPIGRVLWLMVRWARRGDWRFALVGGALLAVVATGFLVR